MNTGDQILDELIKLSDEKYKVFCSRMIPTVKSDDILGVRIPVLRKYAKSLYSSGGYTDFLSVLPHRYYDENNLHAFILEQFPDFDDTVKYTEAFLPYIDNWSTCDFFSPVSFKDIKNRAALHDLILKWINSDHTYTVRFAIDMLLNHFLTDSFSPSDLKLVCGIKSDEYYVNMMIGWYFAEAAVKQYDYALPYFENRLLNPVCLHMAVEKCCESRRVPDDVKKLLRSFEK